MNMNLAQFISKGISFFSSTEKALADLNAKLEAKSSDLQQQLTAALARAEAAEASVVTLQAEKSTATAEIVTLKAAVETEKGRANAVLASQGVLAEDLPAGDLNAGAPAGESAFAKYQRLLAENPRAAGEFWGANAQEILNSRK